MESAERQDRPQENRTSLQGSTTELGRSQVVKAPGFDPGMRRFESYRPSHILTSRLSAGRLNYKTQSPDDAAVKHV